MADTLNKRLLLVEDEVLPAMAEKASLGKGIDGTETAASETSTR